MNNLCLEELEDEDLDKLNANEMLELIRINPIISGEIKGINNEFKEIKEDIKVILKLVIDMTMKEREIILKTILSL